MADSADWVFEGLWSLLPAGRTRVMEKGQRIVDQQKFEVQAEKKIKKTDCAGSETTGRLLKKFL